MNRLLIFLGAVARRVLLLPLKPYATPGLAALAIFYIVGRCAAAVPASGIEPARAGQSAPSHGAVDAIRAGAGSPSQTITDCLLQRPWGSETGQGYRGDVRINYPSLGNKQVDDDIRAWVSDLADAFINHLDISGSKPESVDLDAEIDSFIKEEGRPGEGGVFELWGAYQISRPSSAAVSIVFELWNYTGDHEGNLDIITLNYSLITGQRLELVDIFEKPEVALKLMSDWSRKQLESRTGIALRAKMLMEGTEPLIENFSSLTLTPEGICINFQPWQVAPRYAGLQTVVMPLKELLPSAPLLALWGKGENSDERVD